MFNGGMSESYRMAELAVALSLATDLGTGQPMAHAMRTCLLSLRVADALGRETSEQSCVYYVALLRFLGCTSDASETARNVGGDEIEFNAAMAPVLLGGPDAALGSLLRHVGEGLALPRRVARVAAMLADKGAAARSLAGHCEVGARLARRLGLSHDVAEALEHAYERWDGRGWPDGLSAHEVPGAIRIVTAARDAELWDRCAGWEHASQVLAGRRDRAYDPEVVDVLTAQGRGWLAGIGKDPTAEVLDREPRPQQTWGADGLENAMRAVGDFADLKSPYFHGHAGRVASTVMRAATVAGLPDEQVCTLGRAGLVQDVGRVGVPSGIWDRPGPLTAAQWERVRLHPYLSERVLRRARLTAGIAAVAGGHHERADGSGYHRGLTVVQLGQGSRLLAVADAYHTKLERRPHRDALSTAEAARFMREQLADGRFAAADAAAVLEAAGHDASQPPSAGPSGLTEREVEVLSLIATGLANKQVARRLRISPKTVSRHLEHVYAKVGVRTRAGATLFAVEHGLAGGVG